jgi:hypothetical protein
MRAQEKLPGQLQGGMSPGVIQCRLLEYYQQLSPVISAIIVHHPHKMAECYSNTCVKVKYICTRVQSTSNVLCWWVRNERAAYHKLQALP